MCRSLASFAGLLEDMARDNFTSYEHRTPKCHRTHSASSRIFFFVVPTCLPLPKVMNPKLAPLAHQGNGEIQRAEGNLKQASVQNTLGKSAMSDVSTTCEDIDIRSGMQMIHSAQHRGQGVQPLERMTHSLAKVPLRETTLYSQRESSSSSA